MALPLSTSFRLRWFRPSEAQSRRQQRIYKTRVLVIQAWKKKRWVFFFFVFLYILMIVISSHQIVIDTDAEVSPAVPPE